MTKIEIILNGEKKLFKENISISDMLNNFDLNPEKIAIEQNLNIIFPKDYKNTFLSEGDRIEIVHFVGGG